MSENNLPMAWDPFSIMDRLDDELIVKELQGQTVKTLVYQFEDKGKTVTGLSKAGVDATVREMAKQGEVLRELELSVLDNGNEYVAHVKSGRFMIQVNQQTGEVKEILLDTVFGVKRQPKLYEDGKPNRFAYEQAVSKAARNAKMRLLREDLKQAIIKTAIEQGQVERINSPQQSSQYSQNGTTSATATQAQINKILLESKNKGYDQRTIIQERYGVDSLKKITKKQASELIEWLMKAPANTSTTEENNQDSHINIPPDFGEEIPLPEDQPPF